MGAVAQLPLPSQPHASPQPQNDVALLKMELQAMASAAQAKDALLASLEARLRSALEAAVADRAKLAEVVSRSDSLREELRESRDREQSLQKHLQKLKIRLANVEVAEERLASQLGELEAEAAERAREQSALVKSLRSRLQEKEALLVATRAELEASVQKRASQGDSDRGTEGQRVRAPKEVQALEGRLAKAELLLKRAQSELQQSGRREEKLQRDLDRSEMVRGEQEEAMRRIQRGWEANEAKKPLLMGEAAGMTFRFIVPASIVVGAKAIEA